VVLEEVADAVGQLEAACVVCDLVHRGLLGHDVQELVEVVRNQGQVPQFLVLAQHRHLVLVSNYHLKTFVISYQLFNIQFLFTFF